jgi:hypothetical protein
MNQSSIMMNHIGPPRTTSNNLPITHFQTIFYTHNFEKLPQPPDQRLPNVTIRSERLLVSMRDLNEIQVRPSTGIIFWQIGSEEQNCGVREVHQQAQQDITEFDVGAVADEHRQQVTLDHLHVTDVATVLVGVEIVTSKDPNEMLKCFEICD